MKQRILALCSVVLLMTFTACAAKELPLPPEVPTEPQVTASPTPQITEEVRAHLPRPTPVGGDDYITEVGENTWTEYVYSAMHPIVYDGLLLGGSYGEGMWIDAEGVAEYVIGDELYTLYTEAGAYSNGFGAATAPDPGNGPYAHSVEVREFAPVEMNDTTNEGRALPQDVFAVSASWDCMPRLATAQSLNNETYNKVVRDILAENGLEIDKVNIVQHFRLDFEGDGVDEVVIYAEAPADGWRFEVRDGAYSLLIVRKIINGKVENIVIHQDIHTDAGEFYEDNGYYGLRTVAEVCGFLDLNGDGRLEMIVKAAYYEGFFYNIFEILADGPAYVMGNGLGV